VSSIAQSSVSGARRSGPDRGGHGAFASEDTGAASVEGSHQRTGPPNAYLSTDTGWKPDTGRRSVPDSARIFQGRSQSIDLKPPGIGFTRREEVAGQ